MKRDEDYLRELLFEMEAQDDYEFDPGGQSIGADLEERRRAYHCMLAEDAGLVSPVGSFVRLTNQGHDFVSAIRDDTTWSKTKEIARKSGAATIGMFAEVALALAKEKVKEITGIELS